MKVLEIFLLFFCLFTVVSASTSIEIQISYNSTCFQEGEYHSVGETWKGKSCSKFICQEGKNENEVILHRHECIAIVIQDPPNCLKPRHIYNRNKPYPECCMPVIKCDY